jgi:hypothetical protein
MTRKTEKKATRQQSCRTATINETAAGAAQALKSPASAVTAKLAIATAGVASQPLTASKPPQVPTQQLQKAPAKAVAAQGSLTTAPQSPKPAVQPEPTKLPGKAAVVAEAPTVLAVPGIKVTFVFPICQCCAKRVSLSGDFNGWSPDATPLKRYDDGHWETTVELTPGRYEYKFVRDGEWMPDLLARENVLNRHGTLNSVIEVRA